MFRGRLIHSLLTDFPDGLSLVLGRADWCFLVGLPFVSRVVRVMRVLQSHVCGMSEPTQTPAAASADEAEW